jgi:hypothetical protein
VKKTTLQKYRDIVYPIFTTNTKPYRLEYTADKVYLVTADERKYLIDDKDLSGDYFARLVQLKTRFMYDNTSRDLQQLLLTNAKWGMDSKAIPHDLSKKFAVPAEKRKVKSLVNSLVWVQGISYPFEINTKESFSNLDELYVTIVHINGEWFIKDFSYNKTLTRPYAYV